MARTLLLTTLPARTLPARTLLPVLPTTLPSRTTSAWVNLCSVCILNIIIHYSTLSGVHHHLCLWVSACAAPWRVTPNHSPPVLSPEEVARIVADMQAEIATTALRDEPLGFDRHRRRYFLLGSHVEQAAQHPGILVVEVPQGPLFGGPRPPPGLAKDRLATQTLQWFDSVAAVDALLGWLNPKGPREGPLHERVASYRAALVDAVGEKEGALASSVVGMVTPAEDVAADAGDGAAEDAPATEQDGDVLMTDAPPQDATQAGLADAADVKGPWQLPTLEAELQSDKEAVVDLLDSIPGESYDLAKATPQLLEAVRASVASAASWDVLLAALVVVEEALLPGCFKPWWRPWSVTPGYLEEENKGSVGPGPVRLRLTMLQAALRRAPPPAVGGGRATRGGATTTAAGSRPGGGGGGRSTRATRQVCFFCWWSTLQRCHSKPVCLCDELSPKNNSILLFALKSSTKRMTKIHSPTMWNFFFHSHRGIVCRTECRA